MEYQFCPKCGGRLAAQVIKQNEPERLVCQSCSFVFFLDPKVASSTIFQVDGGIVLVKRAIEPSYGKWVFPGGYVDRGETVEQAAIRETKEECGVDVRLDSLLNVYSYTSFPVVIVVYAAHVVDGVLSAGDECLEYRIFPRQKIPWRELAFPSTRQALSEYVEKFLPDSSGVMRLR